MDIAGPYPPGIPTTDRRVGDHQFPRYLLVGAFVPYGEREAEARYEKEVMDRQAAGLEGPVLLESATLPAAKTLYFVELVPGEIGRHRPRFNKEKSN